MRIALHLGAHATDDGRLVRSLLRSRDVLGALNVQVPGPRRYRQIIRETLNILNGARASGEVQQILFDAIIDGDSCESVVMSHEGLIAIPARAISEEGLYPMSPRRFAAFRNLFHDHDCRFFLALCNPATLVPTLAMRLGPDGYETVMAEASILRLRWLNTITQVVAANPGINLTLWSNEDMPLIWPEVLRAISGVADDVPMEGDHDLLYALLNEEGGAALSAALPGLVPGDVAGRRALVMDLLARFARPEEMAVSVPLPGWSDELIARVSATYVADCFEIAEIPGVNFIAP